MMGKPLTPFLYLRTLHAHSKGNRLVRLLVGRRTDQGVAGFAPNALAVATITETPYWTSFRDGQVLFTATEASVYGITRTK